jgi:hypothetical protein
LCFWEHVENILGAHLVVKEHHENFVGPLWEHQNSKNSKPIKINFGMIPKNKPKMALI